MASRFAGPYPQLGRCPICTAPGDPQYRPFCSKRCADIDLSRWLRGGYVIAGGNSDADEDGDDAKARRPMLPNEEAGDENE